MKRNEKKGMQAQAEQNSKSLNHQVIIRLDESLPLETEEWAPVERILMRLTEFAPTDLVMQLTDAIASFADDQARRAYILGQEDLCLEIKQKVA
jgi:hypothetical protein